MVKGVTACWSIVLALVLSSDAPPAKTNGMGVARMGSLLKVLKKLLFSLVSS